jgi:hypothetical protein
MMHGGRDFLLDEMRARRLLPSPRGLSIQRVPGNDEFPARCTYLGPSDQGCVLEPNRRSATCNYYLCEDGFVLAEQSADPLVSKARQAHDRIADFLGQCDMELAALVTEHFPEQPPWDAAFLDWLATHFQTYLKKHQKLLKRL